MKAIIQRVKSAKVEIDGKIYSEIKNGFLIYLGIKKGDLKSQVENFAKKCCSIRIIEDENQKMNLSLKEIDGEMLIISQFTIYGNAQKGNRPSFIEAEEPITAEEFYNKFISECKNILGNEKVKTGIFRAMMNVSSINSGPVTIIVDG